MSDFDAEFEEYIQAQLKAMNFSVPSGWTLPLVDGSWYWGDEDGPPKHPEVRAEQREEPDLSAMILHQAITMTVTIFGNVLMIFVILRNNALLRRRRITPVQMLMLHMCTSDLLFALCAIFPNTLIAITGTFHGPDVLCKIVKFLQMFPLYASPFLLVAISADRYHAICRPLAAMRSNRYNRPVIYAAFAWSGSLLCSVPQFFIFRKDEYGNCEADYTAKWQYPAYAISFNVVVWLFPSILAGILYYRVCRQVWTSMAFHDKSWKSSRNSTNRSTVNSRPASVCAQAATKAPVAPPPPPLLAAYRNSDASQHSTESAAESEYLAPLHKSSRLSACNTTFLHTTDVAFVKDELDRKRAHTVKLTLTIVAANFVLWAPFCIINVFDALSPQTLSPVFATYVMFFGNLNSCMNPWIWFFFNREQVAIAIGSLLGRTASHKLSSVRRTDCSSGGGHS